MSFSRDALTTRHSLAKEPIVLPAPASVQDAVDFEKLGNWNLAGETYSKIDDVCGAGIDVVNRARLLARAATCFEIASQSRPSARAYSDSARILAQSDLQHQVAGELFNRSAHQHFEAGEYFSAGSSWRAAATEFRRLGNAVLTSQDNIPPVPFSAAGNTISGRCLIAAGDAFLRARGEEVWSCGSYWEAGRVYAGAFPNPNIQSFDAYRNALNATIRFYRTLELDRLRLSLPLTEEERAAKVDPLKILEESAYRCNFHHQPQMLEKERSSAARLQTNRQLASVFHEFSILFKDIGNSREAGIFRRAEKQRL